jgi:drug/metabolite transporter (DMT)-like permease
MGVFGKLAYEAGVAPGALLLLRFAMAAALLGVVVGHRPGPWSGRPARPGPPGPGRSRWTVPSTALALGALGYATPSSLYFAALERIDASLVALVLYTYPVFVTVAAAVLGRDRLTPARCVALAVATGGTLLVLLGAGRLSIDLLGVALALCAAVTYTVYVLVADSVVHRLPPLVLSAWVMTGAALALAARALVTGGLDVGFGLDGWFWIACMAVVSTVVGMLAFFAGLRRTGPSTAAILSTVEPVVTAALAAVTLGEFLTPEQLAGGLLVLSSVAVLQLRPRTRRTARPTGPVEALTARTAAS